MYPNTSLPSPAQSALRPVSNPTQSHGKDSALARAYALILSWADEHAPDLLDFLDWSAPDVILMCDMG